MSIRLGLLSGCTTRSQLCGNRHDMSQLAAASAACSLTSCAPSAARVVANFLIAHFIDPPSLPRSRAPASLPPRESKAPWCMVLAHKWAAKASCSLKSNSRSRPQCPCPPGWRSPGSAWVSCQLAHTRFLRHDADPPSRRRSLAEILAISLTAPVLQAAHSKWFSRSASVSTSSSEEKSRKCLGRCTSW